MCRKHSTHFNCMRMDAGILFQFRSMLFQLSFLLLSITGQCSNALWRQMFSNALSRDMKINWELAKVSNKVLWRAKPSGDVPNSLSYCIYYNWCFWRHSSIQSSLIEARVTSGYHFAPPLPTIILCAKSRTGKKKQILKLVKLVIHYGKVCGVSIATWTEVVTLKALLSEKQNVIVCWRNTYQQQNHLVVFPLPTVYTVIG